MQRRGGWRERWGRKLGLAGEPAPEREESPAPMAPAAPEPDDPTRCPKRWMGKRCTRETGHIGVCRW